MKVQIVGVNEVSFNGSDGKEVNYVELHYTYRSKSEVESFNGVRTGTINTTLAGAYDLAVNDYAYLDYEVSGKGKIRLIDVMKLDE